MIGTTLSEIRERIESLADESGDYHLVCARYGDRPAPAADLWFETRAAARAAARATEQYRDALREYDPQVPYYDVIVCCDATASSRPDRRNSAHSDRTALRPALADSAADDWNLSEPVLDGAGSRQELVEFCHRVAAAVFETLSTTGHDAVESAVMDAYFDLAETLSDPDDLCLCLLESMAMELDRRLTPAEQAELLAASSERLSPLDGDDGEQPVASSLDCLESKGLLGGHARIPADDAEFSPSEPGDGRAVTLRLSDYALSPRGGRLPMLPLVVDLYRRDPDRRPSSLRAVPVDDGWQLEVVLGAAPEPTGLVSAPIRPAE